MTNSPMLIAVAPNGARKTVQDHNALPVTPLELAREAAACADAGASMIHLHVRDGNGNHTLEVEPYRLAIKEIEAAVGEKMLIQVSSESVGLYNAPKQIELMTRLSPHCISCGLREYVKDEAQFEMGARFFSELHNRGTLIQYILYSPTDVQWYEKLCGLGIIPGQQHLLLFVLGRYDSLQSKADDLYDFLHVLRRKSNWMVCAFGDKEHLVMQEAAKLGGHARIGFENNHFLPSGSIAPDNAALVRETVKSAVLAGRLCGNKRFAEELY